MIFAWGSFTSSQWPLPASAVPDFGGTAFDKAPPKKWLLALQESLCWLSRRAPFSLHRGVQNHKNSSRRRRSATRSSVNLSNAQPLR